MNFPSRSDSSIQQKDTLDSLENPPCNEYIIPSGGADLYCRVIGQGDPLLCLHGGPGLTQDYLSELAKLAPQRQIIFYDQRGFGQSTGKISDEFIQMDRFVKDIEVIRNHLGYQKLSILGHSWGGLLALAYLTEYEQVVEKLILYSSLPAKHIHNPNNYDPYMNGIREMKGMNPEEIQSAYLNLFRIFCYQPESADKIHLKIPTHSALNSPLIREAFERTLFEQSYNYEPALNRLRVPTLVIHGDNDLLPLSVAETLHRVMADATLVQIPECGHFAHIEQPDKFFHIVSKFLSLPEQ